MKRGIDPSLGYRSQGNHCARPFATAPSKTSMRADLRGMLRRTSEYSHVSDEEMKRIMKAAVTRCIALLWQREHDPEAYLKSLTLESVTP